MAVALHRARKRFGQHFLRDAGVLDRIMAAVHPQFGEPMVEIGPGRGALTRRLLPAVGRLDAVELDRDLIPILEQSCRGLGQLHVHQGDALAFDFAGLRRDERRLRVVGNLPYNISTPLLFHLFAQAEHIADINVMLQKEVVERLAAPPGGAAYGRLSVMAQYRARIEPLFPVGPGAFSPPPQVESVFVRLVPHALPPVRVANEATFAALVAQAFSQRRKTLRNSLRRWASAAELEALGIAPEARPETLGLAEFAALSNALGDSRSPAAPPAENQHRSTLRSRTMSSPAVNPLRLLNAAGQSVWYDNLHRAMLAGDLERMIREDDLRGITSNPTIFEKAVAGSHAYDATLHQALHRDPDQTSRALFFTLAVEDIGAAADQLLPVYRATDGVDGYVSLEVSPDLAHDTAATVREARELHARLARPNVMIKVPATRAGLAAIEALTAAGISVNVTLLFSLERYRAVAERFIHGLEQRHARGETIERIASVASFFVSRVDSLLDPLLAERRPDLQGKIAIANAKLAYRAYQEMFGTPRFAALRALGAHPQRLLWASTSTKNPAYPELLYAESLIGPDTVNTMPPATYAAFRERGVVAPTLAEGVAEAEADIAALATLGIDLGALTERLEAEGVAAFVKSFEHLLGAIGAKAAALAA